MNINISSYGCGRPLVFFHGWGFDNQVWSFLVPILAEQYTLILVDLPGFGLTSMMDWDEFKTGLLNKLPQQFVLVGWSLGGLYATRLSIENPNRVTHLFNITSSPRFMVAPSWPGITKEALNFYYKNLAMNPAATLKEFITLQVNQIKVDFTPGFPPTDIGLHQGLDVLDSWDLRAALNDLSIPICYLFGRLDAIIPVKVMDTMKINYPNFNYILFRKSAHMPFLSEQKQFITALLEFIV